MKRHYEADPEQFPAPAYKVAGWAGVAFWILGWETEPDEDTEWTGQENRTGRVVGVMVGDDTRHVLDEDQLTPLTEEDYCPGCGQIGCKCYQ